MRLAEYLGARKLSLADFARLIDTTPGAVGHYVSGARRPRTRIMGKIFRVTRGAVTPNDFYLPAGKDTAA